MFIKLNIEMHLYYRKLITLLAVVFGLGLGLLPILGFNIYADSTDVYLLWQVKA